MPTSLSAVDFIKAATNTATHYGFIPLERLRRSPECKQCAEKVDHKDTAADRKVDALHGMLASGICAYFDNKLNGFPGPVLFYSIEQVPRSNEPAISFQIYNVKKSIAEALLIQTIRSLLLDLGYENHTVRVNSLGDFDSVTRYIRELTNFMRKRINDLPAPARELMKEHVMTALMHLIEKEDELAFKSPSPLEYLTDTSRKHFREIVEYLEMSNTPYEIDPKLIGSHECYSDTLFAFDLMNGEVPPARDTQLYIRGGRYDTFVSRMSKRNVPAAGAVVVLRDRKAPNRISYPRKGRTPSIFVVQLGFGPKIKSLMLIDELRHAGIPVFQNIVSDSLSEQLRLAESKNVRYAIIVGQKEYIEGNVILRDLEAQNQENIPVGLLTNHLKKLVA